MQQLHLVVALVLLLGLLQRSDAGKFIADSSAVVMTKDDPGGSFGQAVDISGDWALASSPAHDTGRGAVHIYYFTGWNWTHTTTLMAPQPVANENFGSAVALHEETAVVGVARYNGNGAHDAGGAFVYYRSSHFVWDLEAVAVPADADVEWACGTAVAIRGTYMVMGCPFEDNGGRVYLFQRVDASQNPNATQFATQHTWEQVAVLLTNKVDTGDRFGFSVAIALSYNPDDPGAVKYDAHQLVDVATQNYTIAIGSPSDEGADHHFGSATVFYYNFAGSCDGVPDCYRNRTWREGAFLQPPAAQLGVNWFCGYDVDVDRGVVIAGAPQDSSDGLIFSGAAHVWRRTAGVGWVHEARLRPTDVGEHERYGSTLGLAGNATVVCAPGASPYGQSEGRCIFYLFNSTDWEQATRVTALDHQPDEQFGTQVALDTGAVIGVPSGDLLDGKVYHFGGYEFFPIPPPVFLPEPGSYLVEYPPMVLDAVTGLPSEQVWYSYTNPDPQPFNDTHASGHKVPLPVSDSKLEIDLHAMSSNERLGRLFTSDPASVHYTTWAPTPGYFWEFRALHECNSTAYYCPGVPGDSFRHVVSLAHYSTPATPERETTRSGEAPCESQYYCLDGVRYPCGDTYCFPYPVLLEAAESLNASMRQQGVGLGDRLLVHWSTQTNMVPLNTTERVFKLVSFSASLGSEMLGRWINPSLMELTIMNRTGAADEIMTRLQDLRMFVHAEGGLRRINDTTRTSDFPEGIVLTAGSWGDQETPVLVEAVAEYHGTKSQTSGHGPSLNDSLLLRWSYQLDTSLPAISRADIDALVQFDPPITDIEYMGAGWVSQRELRVIFISEVEGRIYYEQLERQAFSVGKLKVLTNPSSILRSRDRSSGLVTSPTPVLLSGSWGDVPSDVFVTYNSPTALDLHFLPPQTNPLYNSSGYIAQVSRDAEFTDLVHDVFMLGDAMKQEYNLSYYRTFPVPTAQDYYVRVFAMDGSNSTLMPYALSRPRKLHISQPFMKSIISENTMPTQGGTITIKVNDLGRGPLSSANALRLAARFDNADAVGATKATYRHALGCWLEPLDGSIMHCTAEAATGVNYRWVIKVRGVESPRSPFTTSYLPPVVYFFEKESPGRANAMTNGSQLIQLRGANFGLQATNNVTGVVYWPNLFPNVVFTAQGCHVTHDHDEITCWTDRGAGADLRWLVSIADQPSAIISTSYARPTIHSVRLEAPTNPDDPSEMDTRGGEVVVLEGINLGPIRDDVTPTVRYNISTAPLDVAPQDLLDYGFQEFTAIGCEVTQLHLEIRCRTFPGFASRPFLWEVEVLGQVSEQLEGSLRMGMPGLLHFDNKTTPTQAEHIRILTGRHFAKLHTLEQVTLMYRDEVLPRSRWVTTDDTEIRIMVPPGTGALNKLECIVNGGRSNVLHFAYEGPVITNFTLKWQQQDQWAMWQVQQEGLAVEHITPHHQTPLEHRCLVLEVHGRNFGAVPEKVGVTVAGVSCESIDLLSHFKLHCCTFERRGPVVVTVDAQASPSLEYEIDDIIPVLKIHTLTPHHGPSVGSVLNFYGEEFQSGGGPGGWVEVLIPGHRHTPQVFCDIISYDDGWVQCKQRPSDYRYTATVDLVLHTYSYAAQRNVSSNIVTFAYDAPSINVVYPRDMPARGGVLSIAGHSLGSEGALFLDTHVEGVVDNTTAAASTYLQREQCWPVLSWNHTYVACVMPESAGNASITVNVNWTETWLTSQLVTYRSPAPAPKLASGASQLHPVQALLVVVLAVLLLLW